MYNEANKRGEGEFRQKYWTSKKGIENEILREVVSAVKGGSIRNVYGLSKVQEVKNSMYGVHGNSGKRVHRENENKRRIERRFKDGRLKINPYTFLIDPPMLLSLL